MALDKRPHLMSYTRPGGSGGTDPETGFPFPDLPGATFLDVPCRFHLGGSKVYKNEDSTEVAQVGRIRLDADKELPPVGVIVRVEGRHGVVFEGPVREIYYAQKSGRIEV